MLRIRPLPPLDLSSPLLSSTPSSSANVSHLAWIQDDTPSNPSVGLNLLVVRPGEGDSSSLSLFGVGLREFGLSDAWAGLEGSKAAVLAPGDAREYVSPFPVPRRVADGSVGKVLHRGSQREVEGILTGVTSNGSGSRDFIGLTVLRGKTELRIMDGTTLAGETSESWERTCLLYTPGADLEQGSCTSWQYRPTVPSFVSFPPRLLAVERAQSSQVCHLARVIVRTTRNCVTKLMKSRAGEQFSYENFDRVAQQRGLR